MRAAIVIPARAGSTRLPGKVLLRETGTTVLGHVAAACRAAAGAAGVFVAGCEDAVRAAAVAAGCEYLPTRADHPSGTARVAEAVKTHLGDRFDFVVNVQADAVGVRYWDIDALLAAAGLAPDIKVWTAAAALTPAAAGDPAVVKAVVSDPGGRPATAVWFTRVVPAGWGDRRAVRHHVGVYGFRLGGLGRDFLGRHGHTAGATALCRAESLEQIAFLEAGYRVGVVPLGPRPLWAVDTPAQYAAFAEAENRGR